MNLVGLFKKGNERELKSSLPGEQVRQLKRWLADLKAAEEMENYSPSYALAKEFFDNAMWQQIKAGLMLRRENYRATLETAEDIAEIKRLQGQIAEITVQINTDAALLDHLKDTEEKKLEEERQQRIMEERKESVKKRRR